MELLLFLWYEATGRMLLINTNVVHNKSQDQKRSLLQVSLVSIADHIHRQNKV